MPISRSEFIANHFQAVVTDPVERRGSQGKSEFLLIIFQPWRRVKGLEFQSLWQFQIRIYH